MGFCLILLSSVFFFFLVCVVRLVCTLGFD